MSRLYNVALGIDQTVNAALSGAADETLSARAYRCGVAESSPKRRWVLARWFIDRLFFWQDHHCFNAYRSEFLRRHLPSHYSRSTCPETPAYKKSDRHVSK